MPVGTQGTIKGLLPGEVDAQGFEIILANTYHLGLSPGTEVVDSFGGIHNFMGWKRNLLTDSGGFQMVSLLKLAKITEEGVKFRSPYDDSECMLTPEHSMKIQSAIGADIIMQLDDVVDATHTDEERFQEARHRTVRWLDRCIVAHKNTQKQNLFPIVQGGLNEDLRRECAKELIERDTPGFAIGGLSGGEEKDQFWRMVAASTEVLPRDKPRYLMGVGFALDLVVCSALGGDMYDCVFPSRTARFGSALIMKHPGSLNMKQKVFQTDFSPIEEDCPCATCTSVSRAYIHRLISNRETAGCHLLTVHNIHFQLRLMKSVREAIKQDRYPQFIRQFAKNNYPDGNYPEWATNALKSVGVNLLDNCSSDL